MNPAVLVLVAALMSEAAVACRGSSCCQNRGSCSPCDSCENPCGSCPTTPAPAPKESPPIIVNSTNVNNNNFTLPTVVHIENIVRTQNTLTIPINVTVENTNLVNVNSESPTPNCNSTTSIPIPYPVPIFLPVRTGCCNVIHPCVPYGCPWLGQTQCGSTCRSRFMFQPIDPCQGACSRLERSYQSWCLGPNFCRQLPVDCSTCPENFYSDYSTFARCGGCFRPDLLGSNMVPSATEVAVWPNLIQLLGGASDKNAKVQSTE
ncbi:uncharacterized protein LOC132698407 [Cylas formicarius]|uniref:uncharacterized protein LOC132698407 n=1 Tax=Cylas formicarius TaxID=197179 RepID=UPI0029584651|nr:uncharacterized protein LOC132698407 [Cylas formicarius]